MFQKTSGIRISLIALFNLIWVAVIVQSASLVYPDPGLKSGGVVPDNSIVYDARLVDFNYSPNGPKLEIDATGLITVYLVKTSTEVLSNASVQLEVPFLGLERSLIETTSPGVYTFDQSVQAFFSLAPSAEDISDFQVEISDWALNDKQVFQTSFTDYVGEAELGAAEETKVYGVLPASMSNPSAGL